MQGERGEPGFVIAADGAMMSGLPGPIGPKGVKVIFPNTGFTFQIQIHFPHIPLLKQFCWHGITQDIRVSVRQLNQDLENISNRSVQINVNVFCFQGDSGITGAPGIPVSIDSKQQTQIPQNLNFQFFLTLLT